jgi:hypothetical protein
MRRLILLLGSSSVRSRWVECRRRSPPSGVSHLNLARLVHRYRLRENRPGGGTSPSLFG